MAISETDIDKHELLSSFAFHEVLNPKLWTGAVLRIDVHVALLRTAKAFYDFIGIEGLPILDVIMTGSNCAFNYTEVSDIDVHVIVDYNHLEFSRVADNFFTAKKSLWNKTHNITVKGYNVEMYVEAITNPVHANGTYSLLNGWLNRPQAVKPQIDDAALIAKVEAYAEEIETVALPGSLRADSDALLARIKTMRKAGLEKGGEFSIENLTFKGLRNLGYLGMLVAARDAAADGDLSLPEERARLGR